MPKKFFTFRNKDAGLTFEQTLLDAGYANTSSMGDADFALFDHEHTGGWFNRLDNFLQSGRPAFLYPHTPLSYFIWDGHYQPLPIHCNFVHGYAAKRSLELYGYPNRTETIGNPRCETREFTPTDGTRLLFVPARTRGNGGYSTDEYEIATLSAFQFVLDHLNDFEQVTVCYVNGFVDEAEYLTSGIKFVKTEPRFSQTPTADMLAHIEQADIVISCETVACLSVAIGKPTVFYNARAVAATSNIPAAKFELYRDLYSFPLTLEEMTIQDVLDVRKFQNSAVELWKQNNIGGKFDADKFLSIVREYVGA